LLRSLEKLGYIVGSDGLDGGPRDLSASPTVQLATFDRKGAPGKRPPTLPHCGAGLA